VHTAIKNALDAGLITETGISMHFVTDEYDRGPVFFEQRIPLEKGMTEEQIAEAVHQAELECQPKITDMVVHGEISWDGKNASSLVVPSARNF
jgi:phosphoribosylglycinamide formyltransferase-1